MEMNVDFVIKECPTCHVLHAITKKHDNRLRNSHDTNYCPNGHTWYYPQKTDAELLQVKLDACSNSKNFYEDKSKSYGRRLSLSENQNRALKGWITRYKKKLYPEEKKENEDVKENRKGTKA